MENTPSGRILIIDDNPSIHQDFRKIFAPNPPTAELDSMETAFFGQPGEAVVRPSFEIDSAFQGQEGLELLRRAAEGGKPYMTAFVDVRMPPGWDGIETTANLWKCDPQLQVVICTAYSDYSFEELVQKLGYSDRLVILKKPFDTIEVQQLANALTEKWRLSRQARGRMEDLEQLVRARTAELHAANQRLSDLASAAAAGSEAKSEFLANMSHEIRTPMNGVIGVTQLLLETPLNPQQRDFAETIRTSAEALLGIVNDILDFSKIEAGKMTFEHLDFNLQETLEAAVDLLAPKADSKGLELIGSIEPGTPTALRGDALRLRQVLMNLIGNAVKFTEQGEVLVRVALLEATETRATLRFEVKDSGIGIPPEAQLRLFQPFSQADGSCSRRFGGTGLGLAISKHLVEMMQGQIGLDSQPGRGSNFWFTARLDKQTNSAPASPRSALALGRVSVLIVDDNQSNRQSLQDQINSWRMRSACASSGAEALQLLRQNALDGHPYDLALLDLQMPGMDGLTLAKIIQADPLLVATRTVVLSSLGHQLAESDWRRAGVGACLVKPLKQSRLFDCLAVVMGGASSPAPPSPQGYASSLVQGCQPLRILLAEDNSVNQKVALAQLRQLGYTAEVVTNGRDAVQALRQDRYDLLLMDCQMPELDGYEAARHIREQEQPSQLNRPHIYIIAMTAHATKADRDKCLAAGMDDYVSKPVRTEELAKALERWLAFLRKEQQPELSRPASAGPGQTDVAPVALESSPARSMTLASEPPVDTDWLLEACGGSTEEAQALAHFYLEHARDLLDHLLAAVRDFSLPEIECWAHKLNSSSASCGMAALLDPLRELEQTARSGELLRSRSQDLGELVQQRLAQIEEFLSGYFAQIQHV